jgi:methyl-accepting chemotaxis protein
MRRVIVRKVAKRARNAKRAIKKSAGSDIELLAMRSQLNAISRSQAVIEFALDGTILAANDNFLNTLGYTLDEILGQHDALFIEPRLRDSRDYRLLWEKLGRGEHDSGQYQRIGKGGRELWLQGSYNPITDLDGKPIKVIAYATDATAQKLRAVDCEGQLNAVSNTHAVMEFNLDGTVVNANDNFLKILAYSIEEIRGRHHSLVVEPAYRDSDDYRLFWQKLARGEYDAGQYKRIAKGGRELWIQASYNPIMDVHGKPFKIVEYATDITAEKKRVAEFAGQITAIDKTQAVIEFALDGTILTANDTFLRAVGYTLAEIQGKKHSLFVEPGVRDSSEYRLLWEKLGRGEFDAGQYKRIGKGGKELWLQANYNSILDMNGKPFKVVNYASDVTQQVLQSQQLAELVRQVRVAAAQIQTGAEEISNGNVDLSQRAEEQASTLEQTAASMEQMTSSVKQTADNAGRANQLAEPARQQAERGGAVVTSVVQAMRAIDIASRRIADIIGVIDEIAFQSNLLALNAAVEAARAGEQGRGFAVVAAEVRSLAVRSATAAKEIKALIHDSVAKVDEGSKLVDQSGRTLEAILEAVKDVTDIVAEIAAASREQSIGIEQVNKAVMQMDRAIQQNAALVEEASAASQSIVDQTLSLNETIASHRFDEELPVESARPQARRVPSRPWSQPPAKPSRAAAGAGLKTAAVAGVNDGEWQQF